MKSERMSKNLRTNRDKKAKSSAAVQGFFNANKLENRLNREPSKKVIPLLATKRSRAAANRR